MTSMRHKLSLSIFLLLLGILEISAQQAFDLLSYRSVGPFRGGRVTAVAGTAQEPGTFYLGATGGGVWKTTDYGTRWTNVSDGFFSTPSIGAMSVAPTDPNIVYVGTGSDGLRSNVILGKGMYKSIDAGTSWMHIGLDQIGQVGALVIHPDDHNTVFVAAIGQPFKPNAERGVYRTKDGGRNWEKVLFVSNEIGFCIIIDAKRWLSLSSLSSSRRGPADNRVGDVDLGCCSNGESPLD